MTSNPVAAALCDAVDIADRLHERQHRGPPGARNAFILQRSFGHLVDYMVPGECGPATRAVGNQGTGNGPGTEAGTIMNDINQVKDYLQFLQNRIVAELEQLDGKERFRRDAWDRPGGGGGVSRVLKRGGVFEQAGVGFSHVFGTQLPPSATKARPDLAGQGFQAMGVSLVLHPQNPYVPTTHANLRYFIAGEEDSNPAWWFGGGFDLTPYYPFHEDVVAWHEAAKRACDPFGEDATRLQEMV